MTRTGIIWSAGLIGLAALVSLAAEPRLADGAQIATHWNLNGVANGYSSKTEALIVIPLLMAGISAVFALLPLIDPRVANLARSRRYFMLSWIGAEVVLLLVHVATLWNAVSGQMVHGLVFVAVAVLMALLGNAMAKSRSNWFVGLRTPWRLSSEDAWIASNRAAGWGTVATAFTAIVSMLVAGWSAGVIVLVAGTIASLLTGAVISYAVWRQRTAG